MDIKFNNTNNSRHQSHIQEQDIISTLMRNITTSCVANNNRTCSTMKDINTLYQTIDRDNVRVFLTSQQKRLKFVLLS